VVFAPVHAKCIGVFTPSTPTSQWAFRCVNISSYLSDDHGHGSFAGAALDGQGSVVFAPYGERCVGVFNTDTDTFRCIEMATFSGTSRGAFIGAVSLPSGNVGFAPYYSDCVGELQLIVASTPPSPPPSPCPATPSPLVLPLLILSLAIALLFGVLVCLRSRPRCAAQEVVLSFKPLDDLLAPNCLDSSLARQHSSPHSLPVVPAAWPASGGGVREITADDVVLLGLIGEGGFGKVFHGRWSSISVAVKVMRAPCESQLVPRFEREAQLLASLRHPCICAFYGTTVISGGQYMAGHLAIVMEYLEGDSLASFLREVRMQADADCAHDGAQAHDGALGIGRICRWAAEVAAGLAFLHKNGIIHRDVKASNVLLDRSRHRAKVVDFGISKLCEQEQLSSSDPRDATCSTGQGASHSKACHTAEVGTARYAAPEVFAILPATTGQGAGGEVQGAVSSSASGVVGFANSSRAEYSERCDVYSFGLMLWEMCRIRIVFEGEDQQAVLRQVAMGARPEIRLPAEQAELAELIRECWRHDPKERISMNACATRLSALLQQHEGSAAAGLASVVFERSTEWSARSTASEDSGRPRPLHLIDEEVHHTAKMAGEQWEPLFE